MISPELVSRNSLPLFFLFAYAENGDFTTVKANATNVLGDVTPVTRTIFLLSQV
jgi:hypothetical protein